MAVDWATGMAQYYAAHPDTPVIDGALGASLFGGDSNPTFASVTAPNWFQKLEDWAASAGDALSSLASDANNLSSSASNASNAAQNVAQWLPIFALVLVGVLVLRRLA